MNSNPRIIIVLSILLSLTACSKNDDVSPEAIADETVAVTQECLTTESIDNEIDASISTALLVSEKSYSENDVATEQTGINTKSASAETNCMNISIKPLVGGFPKTITIDFGDGCTGENGFSRSGAIAVTITDTLRAPGVSYSVAFENFAVEDYTITGSLNVTNTGTEAVPSFAEDMNLSITGPDGLIISKSKVVDRVWAEGALTDELTDDVYLISGSANVESSTGNFYSYDITTPLKISYSCDPIQEGVLVLTLTGQSNPVTIDFGNGDCDWKARLSQLNKQDQEINF